MKNYLVKYVVSIVFCTVCLTQNLSAQLQSENRKKIGQLLMELEANMTWQSVDAEWEKIRSRWLQQCKGELDNEIFVYVGEPVSQALIELAAHTKSEAMEQPNWNSKKAFWRKECLATNLGLDELLVKQLLEFESHLKWEFVEETWRNRREEWLMACKNIRNEVQSANPNAEEEVMEFLKK